MYSTFTKGSTNLSLDRLLLIPRNLVAISMLLIILAVVIIYPTGAPNCKQATVPSFLPLPFNKSLAISKDFTISILPMVFKFLSPTTLGTFSNNLAFLFCQGRYDR